jgi:hypothetical protein
MIELIGIRLHRTIIPLQVNVQSILIISCPIILDFASIALPDEEQANSKRHHEGQHSSKSVLLCSLHVFNARDEKWLSFEHDVNKQHEDCSGEGVKAADMWIAHHFEIILLLLGLIGLLSLNDVRDGLNIGTEKRGSLERRPRQRVPTKFDNGTWQKFRAVLLLLILLLEQRCVDYGLNGLVQGWFGSLIVARR